MSARRVFWSDVSPHSSGAAQVNDIKLGYLDWGGYGPPLMLLPGLGDTAHIFDALAPRLTGRHRVLGLNRRGHGDSDTPHAGYDPMTFASDIAAFLKTLDLEVVTLVGHSIAGNEMTTLAAAGEPRLKGMIYLDAAYDRSGTNERIRLDPLLTRPDSTGAKGPPNNLDEYRERSQDHFGFWNDALEANLRARLRLNQSSYPNPAPAFVARSIMKASEQYSPSYDQVSVPSLALYAPFGEDHWAPYDRGDAKLRATVRNFMRDVMRPWQVQCMEKFQKGGGSTRTVEIPDAHHYLFLSHENRVVEEILAFTNTNP